jgi:hypothetical protein
MRVLDITGIHEVSFQFCACARAVPDFQQLLRRGFYPSTQKNIQTCATFRLLEYLHLSLVVSKGSQYHCYRTLEKLTDNTGLRTPKPRYRALIRMSTQWRHLKMEKRGGRAHTSSGIEGTAVGELALRCPSCPHPGINLDDNWKDVAPEKKCVARPIHFPLVLNSLLNAGSSTH